MKAKDWSKQQILHADSKAIQQINLLEISRKQGINILEEVKETILDLSQGPVRVLWIYFTLI